MVLECWDSLVAPGITHRRPIGYNKQPILGSMLSQLKTKENMLYLSMLEALVEILGTFGVWRGKPTWCKSSLSKQQRVTIINKGTNIEQREVDQ